MSLYLYNSLSKIKQQFIPIDHNQITMYVCGPTVYDYPHIGNARSIIIYDLLYRLLIYKYSLKSVKYVRNITDIDDKIINQSIMTNQPIIKLTDYFTKAFDNNMGSLNCLRPTFTPKATNHLEQIIELIQILLDKKHAYVSEGHVYFSVKTDPNYGQLIKLSSNQLITQASLVKQTKNNQEDFVLWKPCKKNELELAAFASPWGVGRPGWHIECSAMSHHYLGKTFDIHGGGVDLAFPHHTNELAQSSCAFEVDKIANYWVHNGHLTVNGQKMSKSLDNFITIEQLLASGVAGETIRCALLLTHYRKPLDFNYNILINAKKILDSFYRCFLDNESILIQQDNIQAEILTNLYDDLNTPAAITKMHHLVNKINKTTPNLAKNLLIELKELAKILGLLTHSPTEWFRGNKNQQVDLLIKERNIAKSQHNWQLADQIRAQLKQQGIILEDKKDITSWRYE